MTLNYLLSLCFFIFMGMLYIGARTKGDRDNNPSPKKSMTKQVNQQQIIEEPVVF